MQKISHSFFSVEPLTPELYHEFLPYISLYYAETSTVPITPDPDIDRFISLFHAGALRIHTARLPCPSHALIGLATFIVSPHLLYKTYLQACHHLVYIRPENRGIGKEFISWSIASLQAEGIKIITYMAKPNSPLQHILVDLNLKLEEHIYCKENI